MQQCIKIPYSTDVVGAQLIAHLRRIQSCAVRTAYANARNSDGSERPETEVRAVIRNRFSSAEVDAWTLHCGTQIGMQQRDRHPSGTIVWGGKANFERRRKGLISREAWRDLRLLPLTSLGDKNVPFGNRNIHLVDEQTVVLQSGRYIRKSSVGPRKHVVDRAVLNLPFMRGKFGEIIRQIVLACGKSDKSDRINIGFRIDSTHITVIFNSASLANHPDRRTPTRIVKARSMGIDLNPNWIGMAVAENTEYPSRLSATALLQHELVKLDLPKDASSELVRETLSAVCDRAIRLCRRWHVGTITVEKGLGKLRSGGRNRSLNRLLNYWARTIFVAMLTRKARLAGIDVVEVWGGYSSTIGNLAFEAPDACASAAELARRGIARLAGIKDILPELEEGWNARLWKNERLPAELGSWKDVHRTIKSTGIGYRRPHPDPKDRGSDGRVGGHAVSHLRHRKGPGWKFRPLTPVVTGYGRRHCYKTRIGQ